MFLNYYQSHSISPSFADEVLNPLLEQHSRFPYPCQFSSFPDERESIRFRCAAVPSQLPAKADQSLLENWCVKMDGFIENLIGRFEEAIEVEEQRCFCVEFCFVRE